jgi:hypothetical protein
MKFNEVPWSPMKFNEVPWSLEVRCFP